MKNIQSHQIAIVLSLSVSLSFCLPTCADDSLSIGGIIVEAQRESAPLMQTRIDPNEDPTILHGETGDFMRELPGVTAGRMGGHGLEPMIHGQQQTQLNIINDGAFVHGGCPNRMDPPSAAIGYSLYDSVTVHSGYQSVQNGPGGSGGSILFNRALPQVGLDGRIASQFKGNGSTSATVGDIGYRDCGKFARVSGQFTDAANYKDGNGSLVRSSYSQYSTIFDAGFVNAEDDYQRFSVQYSNVQDALFPGAGMDSPESDMISPRFDTKIPLQGSVAKSLHLSAYASLVDHVMDNYSLRPRTTMFMRAPSTADTFGGKAAVDLVLDDVPVSVGIDSQCIDRSARRYMNMMDRNSVNTLSGILWPDTSIFDIGVFGETEYRLSEKDAIKLGARLDTVLVDADSASEQFGMMSMMSSPNMLYNKYYGTSFQEETETNPSAIIQYSHDLTKSLETFAGFGFVTRTADATERSMASIGATGSWIGNPGINPEQHREIRAGFRYRDASLQGEVSGFHNSVNDYILRDTARGQEGILESDGATIYRNIDASLSGVDLSLRAEIGNGVALVSTGSYTYGEDRDLNQPLPQIPPFSGWSGMEYLTKGLTLGFKVHYAMKQNRVDLNPLTGTGRDIGKTSGYGTMDLYSSYAIAENCKVLFGVTNLFDKTYANHLNLSNSFEPEEVRLNEPGRSVYAGLEVML